MGILMTQIHPLLSHVHPRTLKKPKAVDADDDVTMDGSVKSTRTTRSKVEREAELDLRARKKAYSQRLKFDSSLKWNGTSATFRTLSKALEGHLIMGGAT